MSSLWPVDTARPWLAPYARHVATANAAAARGAGVAAALSSEAVSVGLPAGSLQFVPADSAPAGEAYEAFIFRTAQVPTRDNLHDFFNGLAWLHFPQAKRRLNELQAAEIARAGVGATRGPLRDALTLFDENGAVLDAPPDLWEALLARDWQRLFVTGRALWAEARLLVFGHALLEKLTSPRKALTAHVLCAPGPRRSIAPDDAAIAAAIGPAHLATKPFAPLPVLGVPGWWAANEAPGFYDDAKVFRPPRPPQATGRYPR
ncbi:MAG: DUF3025 domain-containing protein [Variovorax sp.]|nr:MAG: DUF3025 domain-containing protein [Variovorax sp.]